MGNCLVLQRPNASSRVNVAGDKKIIRVVKIDGKIVEYRHSMLVKDLLMDLVGYGIGASSKASQHLPPNHELRVGNTYYLLPSSGEEMSSETGRDCPAGSKRIKLIIPKQQLEELLSKKISMEDVVASLRIDTPDDVACTTSWRPRLETILE